MKIHIDASRRLTDDQLLARVQDLAACGRAVTAELIAHLMEVDARRLYVPCGYSSLFTYCRRALRLSEGETCDRIKAARAARRFPVVLDRLADGTVTLTAVRLLAQHLTADNYKSVLDSARGLSKAEVKAIVARLAPRPDAATSIRKLPAPRPDPTTAGVAATEGSPTVADLFATTPSTVPDAFAAPAVATPTAAAPATAPPTRPATIDPLSPDRYKLQVTIGGDTVEKLRLIKDMIRHAVPSGDEAQILDRALTMLLTDLAKKKFAATEHPRPSPGVEPDSRHVPAEVKRAVFVRDLGRCAFVGTNGHRCEERGLLEFHHVRPYSAGGPPTVENIELRCRCHNLHEWELRSTDLRRQEEEGLDRQAAGSRTSTRRVLVPPRDTGTRSGTGSRSAQKTVVAPPSS